ncbi:MAG: type I-U CRISPR-associated RAMP protein Csb1/Cas7u [Pseudomonadota bacterium]
MHIDAFHDLVGRAAAIRRRQRLQPMGGPGDKIFPPTYPGEGRNNVPQHVLETRRIAGAEVPCVLIDSVQSQANRLEEVLLATLRRREPGIPHLAVDFAGLADLEDIGRLTSLDAPHRVFDAIIRDSEIGGKRFPQTPLGVGLRKASLKNATALFEASPSALLFGAWNSTGEGGGLGAKFPRCLVSEIVGVGVADGKRTGSRIDPLGIRREVEVYEVDGDWTLDKPAGGKAKKVRPSEINHGNIAPSVQTLGVTVDYAEHTAVITFPGLRRIGLPTADGEVDDQRDRAGQAVLAALGLVALTAQDEAGYALRSRCDLVVDTPAPFEIVHRDGRGEGFEIDREAAVRLLGEAVDAAKAAGLPWSPEPVVLEPQARLAELVRQSRLRALSDQAPAED